MSSIISNKATRLYIALGAFFLCNAFVAEFIGIKIFSLEATLGIDPVNWSLFGVEGTLDFTAGVLLWPLVFITTDIINEYFGVKGVRFLSYTAAALIAYAFLMIFGSINLEPASWWVGNYESKGIDNMQNAFSGVFGQGLWIVVGSLTAFLVGQILDAMVFKRIRALTGEKKVWLRATGSTVVSQFFDSFIVLYIAFVLGADWSWNQFLAVGIVNYSYKVIVAIILTPLLYVVHAGIDTFLGKEKAEQLKEEAMQ